MQTFKIGWVSLEFPKVQTWRGFVWFWGGGFGFIFVEVRYHWKSGPNPKSSTREAYGFIMAIWVHNPKDHIKTFLTDTHWISYEVDKVLSHYCSGDSRECNANCLHFNALAFKQVKGTAQAQ